MIYVDPLMHHGWKLAGKPTMNCHLWTDGLPAELHSFAVRIGMKFAWRQVSTSGLLHYDLTPLKRAAAVRAGAIEVTKEEAVELWKAVIASGNFCCDYTTAAHVAKSLNPTGEVERAEVSSLLMVLHLNGGKAVSERLAGVSINGVWFERSPFQKDWETKWTAIAGERALHE